MKKIICVIMCAIFALCALSCADDEVVVLDTPTVSFTGANSASWSPVEGASAYEYKINDGSAVRVDSSITAITLLADESISVRALGDGDKYLDSDWSESVKNNSSIKLPKPTLTTTAIGNQVIVSWEKDSRASSYMLRLNDLEAVEVTGTEYLINATDTFRLQAVGDGEIYISSDWAIVEP